MVPDPFIYLLDGWVVGGIQYGFGDCEPLGGNPDAPLSQSLNNLFLGQKDTPRNQGGRGVAGGIHPPIFVEVET